MSRRTIWQRNVLLHEIHDCGVNSDTREVFLHSLEGAAGEELGVDFRMANRFHKSIRYLEYLSKDPILIHMHTPGGGWEDGMAIYDSIQASPCHITILGYAHARSMSSIILQAADERVLTEHAAFMIHYGTMEAEETSKNFLTLAKELDRQNRVMLDIYATKCLNGRKFKNWKTPRIVNFIKKQIDAKEDVFLTPFEAVEWGLADGVLGFGKYEMLEDLKHGT